MLLCAYQDPGHEAAQGGEAGRNGRGRSVHGARQDRCDATPLFPVMAATPTSTAAVTVAAAARRCHGLHASPPSPRGHFSLLGQRLSLLSRNWKRVKAVGTAEAAAVLLRSGGRGKTVVPFPAQRPSASDVTAARRPHHQMPNAAFLNIIVFVCSFLFACFIAYSPLGIFLFTVCCSPHTSASSSFLCMALL